MSLFDFESICVQEDKLRDSDTAWNSKHVPMSVSISSNLIEQPIFLCHSNSGALVESSVDALDGLATQSKAQMKSKFLEIETSVESELDQNFCDLNQRRCRKEPVLKFEDECNEEEEEEQDVSTQFLQTQKNQLIDLQDHLERVSGQNLLSRNVLCQNLQKQNLLCQNLLCQNLPCY